MNQQPQLFGPRIYKTAAISEDGKYRYLLTRSWQPDVEPLIFVMLNPSTADATEDDPTIKRCMGFARSHDYGGIIVLNLFAYRATDPRELQKVVDPVGPANDSAIRQITAAWPGGEAHDTPQRVWRYPTVVAAWGANVAANHDRVEAVCALIAPHTIYSLGETLHGAPKHPLYLSATTRLHIWRQR